MHRQPDRPSPPFSGLGFDLAQVRARARGMVLIPFRQDAPRARPRRRDTPRPAGYCLLMELSREIRGR